jgi:glutamate-1-semialdehyde 2,1-aminomutase
MITRKPQSAQEKALLERAARHLPGADMGNGPATFETSFIVKEARGSKIYDFSDNEYIDYLLGSGPMVLGHVHPAVVEAVREYLERGSTYFIPNERAIQLAEEICEAVPCADLVRFTTSGTDATFQCMRAARAYRKRHKILKFEGGFHGTSDYALQSVTPKLSLDFPQPDVGSAGIPSVIQDTVLIAPYNDLETTSQIITENRNDLAGVIVEPMQRILTPLPGFLEGLREITASYEIPLIFDEVVTGFRLAYGGAQELYGVVPDLAAFGKIIGGGYPLAAIAGRADIMQAYDSSITQEGDSIVQIGTLNGNPIAATAGLATLAQMRKPGTYETLRATGKRLKAALQDTLDQAEIPASVVGDDTCFDVYFTDREITTYRSTMSANAGMLNQFNKLLLDRGILKGGQKFYISLAHSEADIKRTTEVFKEAAEALQY